MPAQIQQTKTLIRYFDDWSGYLVLLKILYPKLKLPNLSQGAASTCCRGKQCWKWKMPPSARKEKVLEQIQL